MTWLIILISFITLHLICGTLCMVFMYKSNPTTKDFSLAEILIFVLFGPFMCTVYGFCTLYLWIDGKIIKRKDKQDER